MTLEQILNNIISEDVISSNILKTTTLKPFANAIKNKNKITFYYSGPNRPKKKSVKRGYRYKVEPYAIGVNSKGRLILRAYVDSDSGSVSKKGFDKTNWRTFLLGRINRLEITDEVFNEPQIGYNKNGDGKMTTVYIKADFDTQPKKPEEKPKPIEKPKDQVEPKPDVSVEPKPEPKEKEKPEPKPQEKPEPKEKEKPEPKPQEKPEPEPESEPDSQKDTSKELPQPKPEEKPSENPEDDIEKNLQESIRRIKTLMFF